MFVSDEDIHTMIMKAIMDGLMAKFREVMIINPEYYQDWTLEKEMYPSEIEFNCSTCSISWCAAYPYHWYCHRKESIYLFHHPEYKKKDKGDSL